MHTLILLLLYWLPWILILFCQNKIWCKLKGSYLISSVLFHLNVLTYIYDQTGSLTEYALIFRRDLTKLVNDKIMKKGKPREGEVQPQSGEICAQTSERDIVGWEWTASLFEPIRSVNHDFTTPHLYFCVISADWLKDYRSPQSLGLLQGCLYVICPLCIFYLFLWHFIGQIGVRPVRVKVAVFVLPILTEHVPGYACILWSEGLRASLTSYTSPPVSFLCNVLFDVQMRNKTVSLPNQANQVFPFHSPGFATRKRWNWWLD